MNLRVGEHVSDMQSVLARGGSEPPSLRACSKASNMIMDTFN